MPAHIAGAAFIAGLNAKIASQHLGPTNFLAGIRLDSVQTLGVQFPQTLKLLGQTTGLSHQIIGMNKRSNVFLRGDLHQARGLKNRNHRRSHPLGDLRRCGQIDDIGETPLLHVGDERFDELEQLLRTNSTLTQQKFVDISVVEVVKQDAVGLPAVATRTTRLLNVLL